MKTRRKVQPRIIAAAIGLAARHFPEEADGGSVTVTREHVLYVLDGHITDWDRWRHRLSEVDALRFARLLRRRTNQLANADMAKRVLDGLLKSGEIPGCEPADDYDEMKNPRIVVNAGMPLTDFIDQALADLDELHVIGRNPLPPATEGTYSTTTRVIGADGTDETYVDFRYHIEAHHEESAGPLTRIVDAPSRAEVIVPFDELEFIAGRLDELLDEVDSDGYRVTSVRRFERQVRDRAGGEIKELDLAAGELNELLAYTGFGKSVVLIESFACWAVRNEVPVAFVLPTNADVVKATFQIERAVRALGQENASIVPLVSPRSLIKVAETAAARASDGGPSADWIWERFGYGCALAAVASSEKSVDGWVPGREPCAALRQPVPRRKDKTFSCPWRTTCGRYRAAREACTADVIVTSHVNLQLGVLQTPVDDGLGRNDRVTVEELVLRRCQVVVIDEVDSFQRSMIEQAGRSLVLDHGGRTNTPLRRLDQDFGAAFGMLSDEVDASVRDAYFTLRYLAETYVSHLRYERLGTSGKNKTRKRRRGPGRDWIVPQRWDNELANQLFGQPLDTEPTEEQMRLYLSVFPEQAGPEPGDDPKYQDMRDTLREVVTSGLAGQTIAAARTRLAEFFDLVSDDDQALVANRVLRRTILERIRWSLHSLMASNAQLVDIGVESAQDIADALGTYGRWRVMPTGPLGRLVFAFTEYYDDSGNEPARLSTAAFGGDPHLYAISLGDITALAQAGTRRIVLGMSATSYFPHAPHSHLHVRPKWWVSDDDGKDDGDIEEKKVTVVAEQVRDEAGHVLKVSGLDGKDRADALVRMAKLLWPRLEEELARLVMTDPDRARVLLATTSYDGARQVARGLVDAGVPAARICLATRPHGEEDAGAAVLTGQWWELPADRLESFPGIEGADVLIAPLGRVQRGVNIIGAGDRSALGSVWLLVRPIPLIDEPAELLAHIQARALIRHRGPAGDPLGLLEERRKTAGTYFEQIVHRPPYFRCQPKEVKLGVTAEIVVGAIQLIGRARRGGTSAVLHLVDGAFTDGSAGTSFASLITGLRDAWSASGELGEMERYYGRTLRAFLEFADRPDTGDESC
ncbi:hypothetical protein [Lentzea sp. NPDC059081]|uniref:hypothetical protein n=1 Tax=Lentzea sp. NPDC059081 TaxID=3346719 RepID=UPI0036B5B976